MPIRPENKTRYPRDWKAIRARILARAGHCCEWCGAADREPHPVTGSLVVLTIAHLDHMPEHNESSNLAALCQKCHLNYDREIHARNAARTRRERLAAAAAAAGQGRLL